MDHRRRRLIDYPRSRRRIGHGPRSSARKQSHSDSCCGRDYKDFAHSKRSPWARWFEPKTKTKPEALPEGHEPRAPIRLGSEGGVSRNVRYGSRQAEMQPVRPDGPASPGLTLDDLPNECRTVLASGDHAISVPN